MSTTADDRPTSVDRCLSIGIADDAPLFTDGLVLLLEAAGVEVRYVVRSGTALLARLQQDVPDAVLVDVEMPPAGRDQGLVTVREIRHRGWDVPILVLSSQLKRSSALALLEEGHDRVGFLSKDAAVDIHKLLEVLGRLLAGEPVVDDELVRQLLNRPKVARRVDGLTDREKDVLAAMAEGRSNKGIAQALHLSERTVEGYVSSVFAKLDLDRGSGAHARVRAVLLWLSATPQAGAA